MSIYHIINAFILDEYTIITMFSDGLITKYNFLEYMKNAPFSKLEDISYFKDNFNFTLEKIYWDDLIDCNKDTLHDYGEVVGYFNFAEALGD